MGKALRIIVAIIFIVVGVCQIYDGINKPKQEDVQKLEQSSDVFIGDEAIDKDGVVFCVTDVYNTNSLGEGYSKVSTDNNYIVVSVKIINNGKEPYDVNSLRFALVSGDEEYENTDNALFSLDNAMFMDTINPSLSKEYVLVYETSKSTEEAEYKLKIKSNAFSKYDNVYISLKNRTDK